MAEPGSPLHAFSDHAAELVERTAGSVVAVHGGGRWPSSGIHWRSGVIVTTEEVLERDKNIKLRRVFLDAKCQLIQWSFG